jgi:hypothetical protein
VYRVPAEALPANLLTASLGAPEAACRWIEPTPNYHAVVEQEEQTDLHSVQDTMEGAQIAFVFVIQFNGSRISLIFSFPASCVAGDGDGDGGNAADDERAAATREERLIPDNGWRRTEV